MGRRDEDDESDDFVGDIEDVEPWNSDGRSPILDDVGMYLVELISMKPRYSKKQSKTYLEVLFRVVESESEQFPADTEACVQIWPTKFEIHKKKTKALLEAALPGKKLTSALCKKLIDEDLIAGERLKIKVYKNANDYVDYAYKVAA